MAVVACHTPCLWCSPKYVQLKQIYIIMLLLLCALFLLCAYFFYVIWICSFQPSIICVLLTVLACSMAVYFPNRAVFLWTGSASQNTNGEYYMLKCCISYYTTPFVGWKYHKPISADSEQITNFLQNQLLNRNLTKTKPRSAAAKSPIPARTPARPPPGSLAAVIMK